MYLCQGYKLHRLKFPIQNILEIRINSSDLIEINKGGLIGLEGTVFVKVPVFSESPPITSHITWLDPNGLMIRDQNIVLQQRDGLYNHIITSILPVSGAKQYGEYKLLYSNNFITTIRITEKGNFLCFIYIYLYS